MNVHKTLATLALMTALALPGAVAAQEEPLVLPGRDEVAAGETFVAEIFRDWQIRCIRSEGDEAPDRCEMFQLLEEENGNPVAEFRISAPLIAEDGAIANATILTPLDTLLSPGLQLQIDEEEPAILPYAFCRPVGCFVQISLTEENMALFQAVTTWGRSVAFRCQPAHPCAGSRQPTRTSSSAVQRSSLSSRSRTPTPALKTARPANKQPPQHRKRPAGQIARAFFAT